MPQAAQNLEIGPLVFLRQAGDRRKDVINTLSSVRSHIAKRSQARRKRKLKQPRTSLMDRRISPAEHLIPNDVPYHQNESPSPLNFTPNQGNYQLPHAATAPITAALTRILSIYQSHNVLAIRNGFASPNRLSEFKTQFMEESRKALEHPLTATALVARHASMIANVTKQEDLEMMAFQYRNQVSAELRTIMTWDSEAFQTSFELLSRTCWAIFSLMSAELYARNFSAAAIHGDMFFHFVVPDTLTSGQIEDRLVYAALWQETQRAQITLQIPKFCPTLWKSWLPPGSLSSSESETTPVKNLEEVSDLKLRGLLQELQQMISDFDLSEASYNLSSAIQHQPSYQLLLLGASLVKVFDFLSNSDIVEIDPANQLVERRLALAAIYWLRRACKLEDLGFPAVEVSNDTFTCTAGPTILQKLGDLFDLPHFDPSDRDRPQLTLWTLYVAAMAEQTLYEEKANTTLQDFRFNFALVRYAAEMEMHTWAEVEVNLQKILFLPDMAPFSSIWFDVFQETLSQDIPTTSTDELIQKVRSNKWQLDPHKASHDSSDLSKASASFYEPCLGNISLFLRPPWLNQGVTRSQ